MSEILEQILYFLFVLPFLIATEAYAAFKEFMTKRKLWGQLPYFLLVALCVLLVVLLMMGYR